MTTISRHASIPTTSGRVDDWLGWAALALTVAVWAGFSVSIRAIAQSSLNPADVALLRFGIPSLLLLPVMPKRLASLARARPADLLMIASGGGLPFVLLAAYGGRLTSAAHVSTLLAGTTPAAVAALGFVVFRQPAPRRTLPGVATITAGVAVLLAGLDTRHPGLPAGIGLLLCGSLAWGFYTIGLRRAGLDPLSCVVLIAYPSLLLLMALMGLGLLSSTIAYAPAWQILSFAVVQGVCVGLVSTMAYSFAISRLGALRCAMAGALAPVLATIVAVPLLGEAPSLATAIGLGIVTAGVLLSNIQPKKGGAHVRSA